MGSICVLLTALCQELFNETLKIKEGLPRWRETQSESTGARQWILYSESVASFFDLFALDMQRLVNDE